MRKISMRIPENENWNSFFHPHKNVIKLECFKGTWQLG